MQKPVTDDYGNPMPLERRRNELYIAVPELCSTFNLHRLPRSEDSFVQLRMNFIMPDLKLMVGHRLALYEVRGADYQNAAQTDIVDIHATLYGFGERDYWYELAQPGEVVKEEMFSGYDMVCIRNVVMWRNITKYHWNYAAFVSDEVRRNAAAQLENVADHARYLNEQIREGVVRAT